MTVLAWTSPLAHIRVLDKKDFESLGADHGKVTVDRRDEKTKGQYEFPDDVADVLLDKDPGWEKVDGDDVVIKLKDPNENVDDDNSEDGMFPPPPED